MTTTHDIRKAEWEFGTFIDGSKVSVADYHLHLNRYLFATRFTQDKVCLDVGCGTGYGSSYLAGKGAGFVAGGDYSEEAIAFAGKSLASSKTNINYQVLDATSLPFDDCSFEVLVSFEIIEHLKEYRKFVTEARRVLKKDGVIILSTPNRQAGPFIFSTSWNHHHHEFTASELIDIMKSGFDNIEIYGQYPLNNRQLLLKRLTQTAGRSLEVLRMNSVKDWLGKTLLPHNHLVIYRTADFDRFQETGGKVVKVKDGVAPVSLVVVARKN